MPEREFYVGYLALPPGMRRFLKVFVPVLLVGVVALGVVIATRQDDPGDGTWETDQLQIVLDGDVIAAPYTMLLVNQELILLVQEGKHSFDQTGRGSLKGHWISRDGVRMLEVVEANLTPAEPPTLFRANLPPVEHMRGQIIDPKCYLGAMKPGEGKVHKACATLCIKGGIPPMFRDDTTGELYLLTDAAGDALLEPILPYVADPITVSGELEQLMNLKVLKLDVASIQRVE